MFSNDKKNSNSALADNVKKLNDIIFLMEETLVSEERKYDELNQIKGKLHSLEQAKNETLSRIEREKEKLEKLYQHEKLKVSEIIREKEEEKNREIEALKIKLIRESEIALASKVDELTKFYEEKDRARVIEFDKEKEEYKNKIKQSLNTLNSIIFNKIDKVKSEITSINSDFSHHFGDTIKSISGYANEHHINDVNGENRFSEYIDNLEDEDQYIAISEEITNLDINYISDNIDNALENINEHDADQLITKLIELQSEREKHTANL